MTFAAVCFVRPSNFRALCIDESSNHFQVRPIDAASMNAQFPTWASRIVVACMVKLHSLWNWANFAFVYELVRAPGFLFAVFGQLIHRVSSIIYFAGPQQTPSIGISNSKFREYLLRSLRFSHDDNVTNIGTIVNG